MKVCTCLLLFRIFAFTNSVSQLDERSGATKNIEKENNFKAKINDKYKNLKLVFRAPKVDSFVDFVQETIDILNIFEDDAFEEFFLILDNEIRNYNYKGCKFSELTENHDTRNLLTRTLKTIRWKPITFTKANINELADKLRNETYDKSVKELLNYINVLYKNSKKKFHRFLTNLNHFRKSKSLKTHKDLLQVIRDGVRSIFFNHYSQLDANSRRELIKRIETFWEKFKKIPNSNAQINNVETDSVRESRIQSSEDSKNEAKEPELHFKQAYVDHSKDQEAEDDLSSSKSGDLDTAEELSSRQTFDSSSNSIKLSQERQQEYNTQRYMTLYTEEISYKARTSKEIMPMSKIVMTKRHREQGRPTTTPEYRLRDVMKKRLQRTNQEMADEKQYIDPNLDHDRHEPKFLPLVRASQSAQRREPHKPDKSRSKSRHKNAQIISQYDAVIDVRLDNPDLLESLRMFAPAKMARYSSYNTSPHPKSAAERRKKTEIIPLSPTAPTKYPLRHSISFKSHHIKPVNELRRRITPSPFIKRPVERFKENKSTKTKSPTRRSGNDNKDFNKYVMKRIDALEKEIKELKQMNIVPKVHENKEIQFSNLTAHRKDTKDINIERFLNKNQNLDTTKVIKDNDTEYNANSEESNTNSSTTKNNWSVNLDMVNNDTVNATIIETKTTTKAIDNNTNTTTTKTEEISKEATNNTLTSSDRTSDVMDTTTVERDDTTPASGDTTPASDVPGNTMAYSQPMYNDYPDRSIDPFDHIKDGLDLNK